MTEFRFMPWGAPAPPSAAACDGLVENAALDLSHWGRNRTPQELKRDTSVEIALTFARTGEKLDLAVNNHFDTDGALAVFALVNPEVALAHAPLLIAAAEAGDFEEWPSDDRGLRLEIAVRRLGAGKSEADAYATVLRELPSLLANLDAREDLWGDGWQRLQNAPTIDSHLEGAELAVHVHPAGVAELPGPRLHRAAHGKWNLLAFERAGGLHDYRLERARYAWADTVSAARPPITAPSRNATAAGLSRSLDVPLESWALKGDLGMTGALRTAGPIARDPTRVAACVRAALNLAPPDADRTIGAGERFRPGS